MPSGNIDLTQRRENPIVEHCVLLLLLPAAPLTNLPTLLKIKSLLIYPQLLSSNHVQVTSHVYNSIQTNYSQLLFYFTLDLSRGGLCSNREYEMCCVKGLSLDITNITSQNAIHLFNTLPANLWWSLRTVII